MKQEIVNCMSWLTNKMSEIYVYCGSPEFSIKEFNYGFDRFYEELKRHIDFEKLTVEEARELRFGKWDDESDLWLFPLWLVPIIPEGLEVMSISGEKYKYEEEKADKDIRFGCVAFGIEIKK